MTAQNYISGMWFSGNALIEAKMRGMGDDLGGGRKAAGGYGTNIMSRLPVSEREAAAIRLLKTKKTEYDKFKDMRDEARYRNPARPRIAVLKSTTGYKDRAGKFHAVKNPKGAYANKYHRDGTVTFWSVYLQTWRRMRADRIGDEDLAAMSQSDRKRIAKMAAVKNPLRPATKNPTFPVGKFVKVDAVKVNRNGTIDVMRSTSKRPKR